MKTEKVLASAAPPIRDGHTLSMALDKYGDVVIAMNCPHGNADLSTMEFNDLPASYQTFIDGELLEDASGKECNICTWFATGHYSDFLSDPTGAGFEIESLPVHVEWSFHGWDAPTIYPYNPRAAT
jgi:hypothetical protein